MLMGLALSYAATTFIDLYQGNDPNIRENFISDSYGTTDYMTFTDDLNFRLAVGIRKLGEKTLIDTTDPTLVRWLARMASKDDKGILSWTDIPLHDCTAEDFEGFNLL